MKGFPNQVADLEKIATAMHVLVQLVDNDADARDDGVFGPELVRAGVAGTGHTPRPIEAYIREQLRKEPSNQSFRTTARGLRELFRLLGFIDDSGGRVQVSNTGRQAAAFAGSPMDARQIDFWRRVIRNMTHQGTDREASHPYQVLLRLAARKPGITRAKCALALEARNDSPEELERIVALADLSEDAICRRIGVTKANWDNAKKVLPKFAEQLGDVVRSGQSYVLADFPGRAETEVPVGPAARVVRTERPQVLQASDVVRSRQLYVPRETPEQGEAEPSAGRAPRAPRASREVTPETIGRAGTVERFDEVEVPPDIDPVSAREAVRRRLDRLRRHNLIVQALAVRLRQAGARLYEDPFDVLALVDEVGILGEVKTLDGTEADERDRVQEALAQLLYYEAFVTAPVVGAAAVHKIACFERQVSDAHQEWLNGARIATIWQVRPGRFAGNALACRVLGGYLEELR